MYVWNEALPICFFFINNGMLIKILIFRELIFTIYIKKNMNNFEKV